MSSESDILGAINSKRSSISGYRTNIANMEIKLEHMQNALATIQLIYGMHCYIFESVAIRKICNGYDIELVSAEELAEKAKNQLRGILEERCRDKLEAEIQKTKDVIDMINNQLISYRTSISNLEHDISTLSSKLVQLNA